MPSSRAERHRESMVQLLSGTYCASCRAADAALHCKSVLFLFSSVLNAVDCTQVWIKAVT
jgi:hypothetical protein